MQNFNVGDKVMVRLGGVGPEVAMTVCTVREAVMSLTIDQWERANARANGREQIGVTLFGGKTLACVDDVRLA
jgi:hypothetical protein